jgi:predicted enzyme related to lactoylglutathione lyase
MKGECFVMTFGGICITTNDAPRLAAFYQTVFQQEPFIEGEHYAFGSVAVYNPGDVSVPEQKNIWLQCFAADLDAEYVRLQREIPGVDIISPPERRPWGAYSFWFRDPDGNSIAVAEKK